MWFNPDDLLTPSANSANSANPALQISKLARLADPLPVKTPDDLLITELEPLATFATLRLCEGESRKVAGVAAPNNQDLIVICYTPLGNPVEVVARDRDHAEQLRRWNPEPEARPN